MVFFSPFDMWRRWGRGLVFNFLFFFIVEWLGGSGFFFKNMLKGFFFKKIFF
jgi:hypothetical protein